MGLVRSGRRHGRNERDNPEGDTIHKQSGRKGDLQESDGRSLFDPCMTRIGRCTRDWSAASKKNWTMTKSRYYVKTGIVEREFLRCLPTICCHQWMKVIWQKNLYDMKEILRAVEEEGAFRLMKVMLRCDFPGTAETAGIATCV